jgi:hypothetical protein
VTVILCHPWKGRRFFGGRSQLIEEDRTVAAGKLVAISDKYIAIFDGGSILIYSLRNRAVKSTLPK